MESTSVDLSSVSNAAVNTALTAAVANMQLATNAAIIEGTLQQTSQAGDTARSAALNALGIGLRIDTTV